MGSSSSSQGYVWGERRGERGGGARKPGVGGGGWGARGAGRRGLQETQFSARHKGLGRVFTFTFFKEEGWLTYRRSHVTTFPFRGTFRSAARSHDHTRTRTRTNARSGSASVQDMAGGREHRRTNGRTHIPRGSVQVPPTRPGRQSPPSLLFWTSVGASEVTKFTEKA